MHSVDGFFENDNEPDNDNDRTLLPFFFYCPC